MNSSWERRTWSQLSSPKVNSPRDTLTPRRSCRCLILAATVSGLPWTNLRPSAEPSMSARIAAMRPSEAVVACLMAESPTRRERRRSSSNRASWRRKWSYISSVASASVSATSVEAR